MRRIFKKQKDNYDVKKNVNADGVISGNRVVMWQKK